VGNLRPIFVSSLRDSGPNSGLSPRTPVLGFTISRLWRWVGGETQGETDDILTNSPPLVPSNNLQLSAAVSPASAAA